MDIGPPAEQRLHEALHALRQSQASVRWVRTETLHMTLAYLGNLDLDRIPPALEAARRAVGSHATHRVEFSHLGVFPGWKNPRVIWVGAGQGGPVLTSAVKSLRRELSDAGFEMPEEDFTPHVTLGRVKKGAAVAPLETAAQPWMAAARWSGAYFDIDRITLYESKLSSDGPAFTAQGSVALN